MSSSVVKSSQSSDFISTSFHDEFLADLMLSHMVSDFCVIGPRVSSCSTSSSSSSSSSSNSCCSNDAVNNSCVTGPRDS